METDSRGETVDELRERLRNMKRLMEERQEMENEKRGSGHMGVVDGTLLSVVFGVALAVIVTVSVYAFYHLYHAILKKFPSRHTEL